MVVVEGSYGRCVGFARCFLWVIYCCFLALYLAFRV